jgi:hypothetical protein
MLKSFDSTSKTLIKIYSKQTNFIGCLLKSYFCIDIFSISLRNSFIYYLVKLSYVSPFEKNDMGWACSAYEGGERRVQGFGEET